MATLADELLHDFDDSDAEGENGIDEAVEDVEPGEAAQETNRKRRRRDSDDVAANGMELDDDEEEVGDPDDLMAHSSAKAAEDAAEDHEEAKARIEKLQLKGVDDVRSVAGLMKKLSPVLEKIAHYKSLPPDQQTKNEGSIEDNPEYRLLTQSNTLSTQIDNEMMLVHKFIRDHYSLRFPELESLVTNPLDYAKTVAIIGNGPMDDIRRLSVVSDNIVGQPLKAVLDGPSLMVVTVEATTTRGRVLSEPELTIVTSACEMTLQLDKAKGVLTEYVQSRMDLFAPNLTALIGSLTAAQLLNYAGGLNGLAKTPSCNLPPLGSRKQAQTGLATNVGVRHQGFLYHSPLVRNVPGELKKQALRIVAAKVVLAARVDRVHSSAEGAAGEGLRQQCVDRLEKLTEPAPNKGVRALPAPDDKPARKRGGRRARKAKEATAMTDLRRAQNRMAFGQEEAEVGYGDRTVGLGMVGMPGASGGAAGGGGAGAVAGRVRAQQIDPRTRAKIGKKSAGWGAATAGGGGGGAVGGTASVLGSAGSASVTRGHGLRTAGVGGTMSTIAFTPLQGLELVDPKRREELQRERRAEEDRWFRSGTFTQVGSGSASGLGVAAASAATKIDGAGFKVPPLPASVKR